jgi:hypothetical protein
VPWSAAIIRYERGLPWTHHGHVYVRPEVSAGGLWTVYVARENRRCRFFFWIVEVSFKDISAADKLASSLTRAQKT